uniref:Uncharacterized protein n=1 Tax=Acrobeloides nanus TaxID=290746 RepID=A0A914E5P6_9BILA
MRPGLFEGCNCVDFRSGSLKRKMAKGGITDKVTLFLIVVAVALGIASVILNIVILSKKTTSTTNYVYSTDPPATNQPNTNPPTNPPVNNPTTDSSNGPTKWTAPQQQCYQVSDTPGFKAAAESLLYGLDTDYDPCEDFYMFTCGNFLKNTVLTGGESRNGTYDMSQANINRQISNTVANLPATASQTEKIFKHVYDSCYASYFGASASISKNIYNDLIKPFGGFPALDPNWAPINKTVLWQMIGTYESSYALPSLLQSLVSVDYMNNSENALYLYQGPLALPRDFYVLPQFLKDIDDYLEGMIGMIQGFKDEIGLNVTDDYVAQQITSVIELEVNLALAMVPDDLMRNSKQQYNPYKLDKLQSSYSNIDWNTYYVYLLSSVDKAYVKDQYIVAQPAFLRALDDILHQYDMSTIVNFVMMRLIQGTSGVIGGDMRSIMKRMKNKVYKDKVYDQSEDAIQDCMESLMVYMPYGMGYTYIKYIQERDLVKADVKTMTGYIINAFVNMTMTLEWMTEYSKEQLVNKKNNLIKNIGWPHWFLDFSPYAEVNSVDPYHYLYKDILSMNQSDYYHIYLKLTEAYQLTENFQILEKEPDRQNFLQSPAMVNAWYIPERNSITFPYAAFNPPYYRLDFPQAYNYAGQGGTAGHELTHGYDDEGVQFGPTGELADCEWNRCGWMDRNSTLGFIDMAQCVVSQYSSQCCPIKSGSVHCANGATTQGENIADLGGQQSAYKGYRKYVEEVRNGVEEPRLPGLEQFTPNQIFWMSYGYSWCMQQSQESLVNQLLTNPHAPGSCRVNQVMQDIPEFGIDFNCKKGSTNLYPSDQQRCKVWTGV